MCTEVTNVGVGVRQQGQSDHPTQMEDVTVYGMSGTADDTPNSSESQSAGLLNPCVHMTVLPGMDRWITRPRRCHWPSQATRSAQCLRAWPLAKQMQVECPQQQLQGPVCRRLNTTACSTEPISFCSSIFQPTCPLPLSEHSRLAEDVRPILSYIKPGSEAAESGR